MRKAEHKALHVKMHKTLDALIADWISGGPDRYPSKIGLYEFMQWSHQQTINPEGQHDGDPLPEEDTTAWRRADQSAICSICKLPYGAHKTDRDILDYDGNPFLNILCDGTKVKL